MGRQQSALPKRQRSQLPVLNVITGKPDFAAVVIIHVDYVKRVGNNSTLVQGVDFNKAPDGSFKLHLS